MANEIQIPNLGYGQKAYSLDGGVIAVVEIKRVVSGPQHEVWFVVRAWQADDQGVVLHTLPEQRPTVNASALADGRVTVAGLLAEFTDAALTRLQNWLLAQQYLDDVPVGE